VYCFFVLVAVELLILFPSVIWWSPEGTFLTVFCFEMHEVKPMITFMRRTFAGCVVGVVACVGEVRADERVYVPQVTTVSDVVYVRQAMQLPDRRGQRREAARAQRDQSARAPQQTASDAEILELDATNAPSLPIAHVGVP
jgi:hypothetical protein